jgi:hypothetical protein
MSLRTMLIVATLVAAHGSAHGQPTQPPTPVPGHPSGPFPSTGQRPHLEQARPAQRLRVGYVLLCNLFYWNEQWVKGVLVPSRTLLRVTNNTLRTFPAGSRVHVRSGIPQLPEGDHFLNGTLVPNSTFEIQTLLGLPPPPSRLCRATAFLP